MNNLCARYDCHEFATHTAVFRNGLIGHSATFLCDEHAQQAEKWRIHAMRQQEKLDELFGESAHVIVITKGMPI